MATHQRNVFVPQAQEDKRHREGRMGVAELRAYAKRTGHWLTMSGLKEAVRPKPEAQWTRLRTDVVKVAVDENGTPRPLGDLTRASRGGEATAKAGWALGGDYDAYAKARGEASKEACEKRVAAALGPGSEGIVDGFLGGIEKLTEAADEIAAIAGVPRLDAALQLGWLQCVEGGAKGGKTTMAKEGKTADGKSVVAKKLAEAVNLKAGHGVFEPMANEKEMVRLIDAVEHAGKLPDCATPNGTGGQPKGSFSLLRWTRVVGELKLVDECWMKQVGGNTRTNKLYNNLKTMHAALAAFVITECEKRAAAAGRPFASRKV